MEINLEVKDFGLIKKGHCILSEINLSIGVGVHVIMGPNGSGKTSLLRTLAGIDKPTAGKIFLDNQDIFREKRWFYNRLGYLPQNFMFYQQMNCRQGLLYLSVLKGIDEKFAEERVSEVLQLVGLNNKEKYRFEELSGGLKKRLGIAQALLNDPDLLILDEPTSALDPAERLKLRLTLKDLGKERIIVFSTHFIEDVVDTTTLTVLNNNKISFHGKAQEIASLPNVGSS